jgi:hypothetical protein
VRDVMNTDDGEDDELKKLRKELTWTRVGLCGLLVVLGLSYYGARRIFVQFAFSGVLLVLVFLGCRWGLGDIEMSLGQSIGVTLTVAAMFLLMMLWGAS